MKERRKGRGTPKEEGRGGEGRVAKGGKERPYDRVCARSTRKGAGAKGTADAGQLHPFLHRKHISRFLHSI